MVPMSQSLEVIGSDLEERFQVCGWFVHCKSWNAAPTIQGSASRVLFVAGLGVVAGMMV